MLRFVAVPRAYLLAIIIDMLICFSCVRHTKTMVHVRKLTKFKFKMHIHFTVCAKIYFLYILERWGLDMNKTDGQTRPVKISFVWLKRMAFLHNLPPPTPQKNLNYSIKCQWRDSHRWLKSRTLKHAQWLISLSADLGYFLSIRVNLISPHFWRETRYKETKDKRLSVSLRKLSACDITSWKLRKVRGVVLQRHCTENAKQILPRNETARPRSQS
jgi:hypothetical protein